VIPFGEIWMPIESFERYEVSDRGRVRKVCPSGLVRIFRPSTCTKGYPQVRLRRDGRRYQPLVHQLVACAFLGRAPDDGYTYDVHHKDDVRSHNWPDNLEYLPHKEHWRRTWRSCRAIGRVFGRHTGT
jgi:hypothetical protein